MRRRRDADGPGGAGHPRPGLRGCLVPDRRTSVGIDRDIDDDLAEKCAVAVEHLDAVIAPIRYVDIPLRIHGDAVESAQLPGPVAGFPPRLEPIAVLVDLGNPRVDVPV